MRYERPFDSHKTVNNRSTNCANGKWFPRGEDAVSNVIWGIKLRDLNLHAPNYHLDCSRVAYFFSIARG